jgi:hypothetical protein
MRKLLFATLSLAIFFTSFAQSEALPVTQELRKVKQPSRAYVQTPAKQKIKGWLYACNDSQVVLVRSLKDLSTPEFETSIIRIPIEQINQVSLRKKNSILNGALIGFGAGVLTGVIIGFASGDDQKMPVDNVDPISGMFGSLYNAFTMTAGEKALYGGMAMGVAGTITGIIIGSVAKKKFIIGGKKQTYRDLQSELMMRLVQK